MAIRKLVELDGEYGYPKEVDIFKIKRAATKFKSWLLTVDCNNDPFGFLQKDLPLVDAALHAYLPLPYRHSNPHNWEIREGQLDWYLEIAAPFYNSIRGADLCDPPQVIEKDGKYFAWCEFEEAEPEA